MEYISSSTRRLTRSLRSLVSYRVKTRKRNCISTRAHVLFFITLRLSSVMLLGTLFFALSKYFSPSSTDNYLQRVVLFMREEALRILFRLVIFSQRFPKTIGHQLLLRSLQYRKFFSDIRALCLERF